MRTYTHKPHDIRMVVMCNKWWSPGKLIIMNYGYIYIWWWWYETYGSIKPQLARLMRYVRVYSEVVSRSSETEQPLGLLPALRQIHFIHSNLRERCNPAYFLSGMLPVSCANPERELELTTRTYVTHKTNYTCRPRSDAPTNMTIVRVAFSSHVTCHCMPR